MMLVHFCTGDCLTFFFGWMLLNVFFWLGDTLCFFQAGRCLMFFGMNDF